MMTDQNPTQHQSPTGTDEAFESSLCLRVLPVPAGMPLCDWAVVRLETTSVVRTCHDEAEAGHAARRLSEMSGWHHIACPTIIDRTAMPYRARVEVLI